MNEIVHVDKILMSGKIVGSNLLTQSVCAVPVKEIVYVDRVVEKRIEVSAAKNGDKIFETEKV